MFGYKGPVVQRTFQKNDTTPCLMTVLALWLCHGPPGPQKWGFNRPPLNVLPEFWVSHSCFPMTPQCSSWPAFCWPAMPFSIHPVYSCMSVTSNRIGLMEASLSLSLPTPTLATDRQCLFYQFWDTNFYIPKIRLYLKTDGPYKSCQLGGRQMSPSWGCYVHVLIIRTGAPAESIGYKLEEESTQ